MYAIRSYYVDNQEDGNSKSVEFIKSLNKILKNTPYELAYRALNVITSYSIHYTKLYDGMRCKVTALGHDLKVK